MFDTFGKICIGLAIVAVFLTVLLGLIGCGRLFNLEQHIRLPTTQPAQDNEAAQPLPILDIIAGILALAGFGGIANWVRRLKVKQDKIKNQLANQTPTTNTQT